ncbi:hypothetical protein E6W39_09880 [Kitasatospora acidiphila]|uniref:Lipase n=1 Tax=Kitasatospora acidiphila TaxID=2567942 RepID=A0A540W0J1_9ACTN|nr:hypothetical protein [Kitasatospora acidiphila]TQF02528.1 hypothetical protein E6W39_09880 [Kitasatospora acidiphila]
MVSMYYPARPGTGGPAPYMTTAGALAWMQYDNIPNAAGLAPALTATRTWAYTDARPAPGRFPLVLLSPGLTMPRSTLTSVAVDLASRGYVGAFFDLQLKGIPQPLLDGPSPANPEVTFEHP